MDTGKLKHKLIFENLANEEPRVNLNKYTPAFKVKGNVQFLKGRSYYDQLAYNEEIIATVMIRRRDDVDTNMRILFKSYIFSIDSIIPDDTERYLIIRVKQTRVDR